ncbi:PQQ-binding-like beta-propeller repeat protein [Micromonospora sp. NPDC051296]|uniref:outer membrane protein assembly factor BamB family protein n=1 Tax=Micromonospora sp. NPDC051296 TaxID=3155046 RepID=UPI00342AA4EE
MTLIELGELTEPTGPEPSRRRGPARNRRLWAALVALIALLTLAGAAPPAPRMQAILPSSLAAQVFLTGDQILTVVPVREATDGSEELLAYQRPERATGTPQRLTPLWRMPVGPEHRVTAAERVDDAGLVLSLIADDGTETLLLDSRTGQPRWRKPGTATPDASGRVLLQTGDVTGPITLAAVELASGRELWSVSSKATLVTYHKREGVIDAIVVSMAAGGVEVLDPETGALRDRLPATSDEAGGYQRAWVVGDLVLVRNSKGVVAYDIDGMVRRWQTAASSIEWVVPCGALLCTSNAGGGAHMLDPATGAIRWSIVDDVYVLRADDRRALVSDHRGRPAGDVTTIDAGTGRIAADDGTWDLVREVEYAPYLLGTRPIPKVGAVLARLDPTQAQARRIDMLPGAVGNCQYREDLIACRRQNGDFGLWQLRD